MEELEVAISQELEIMQDINSIANQHNPKA